MLNEPKDVLHRLYTILYGLVLTLLVIPWAIYDAKTIEYSYLPRRVVFVLMALVALLITIKSSFGYRQIVIGAVFLILGLIHWKVNGYHEPHYLFQFAYLEISLLLIFAPVTVKEKMLKYSSIILYVVLAKALFFRMGSYVHGGFYSSNLFATYIVYLSFIEVYRKRYWNLIPAAAMIYIVGSKACYIAMLALVLFAGFQYLLTAACAQRLVCYLKEKRILFSVKNNFYVSMFIAAFVVLVFTKVMVKTEYYQQWSTRMAPSKAETTANNMIMYNINITEDNEHQREVLLKTKEMQFHDNELKLTAAPLITDVGMSVGLRLAQYDFIYNNLGRFFWIGDSVGAQKEIYGHNPHSAFPDFVSRLGLLYLILVLILYVKLFKSMDLLFCNLCVIPILAFQPYGFTIGHSIVILSLAFSLAKVAKEKASDKNYKFSDSSDSTFLSREDS